MFEYQANQSLLDVIKGMNDKPVAWKKIESTNLDIDYTILFPKHLADELLLELERTIEYYPPELCKVFVYGKHHDIPRQMVAYSDPNLQYKFSGNTQPGKPWTPTLWAIRSLIASLTSIDYNFVLVNRYRDGKDHIGEHRDNEPDLDPSAPIASLSLGADRDFVLRHKNTKNKLDAAKPIQKNTICLEHGSLLVMNPPTNHFWYHSLPPRKRVTKPRVNLTFRKLVS